MKRLTLVAFVMIFATASTAFSQGKAGATGQPRELVVAGSSLGPSRARVLNSNLAVDSEAEVRTLTTATKATATNHSNRQVNVTDNVADSTLTRPRASAVKNASGASPVALNQIYRVGVGDVLDVRVIDMPTAKSTLFTVLAGGVLDYPLSSGPVAVAGLTPEEIAVQLQANIKVLDNPKISVKVRDYSSHSVIVTGSVLDPGTRFLRREATPLYVVLAEAHARPEAFPYSGDW